MMKQVPSDKKRLNLNSYKDVLVLSQEQRDIIIGTCLGDLYIRKIGKFSRLVFEQKNTDYLFHLYEKFKDFTRTPPKERKQQRLKTSEIKKSYYFSTISHSLIHDYHLLFYPQGKKFLPDNLQELLTPRALAYWVMDDGTKAENTLRICTGGFTLEEHIFLQKILDNKFNIKTNIQGLDSKTKQLQLYIQQKSYLEFKKLIKPYVLPSMYYKLEGKKYSEYTKNDYKKNIDTFVEKITAEKKIKESWLEDYDKIFYPLNKRIEIKHLEKILTPKILALWFMKKGMKSNGGFLLNSNNFHREENEQIVLLFKNKFNILVSLQGINNKRKNRVCLYIKKNHAWEFENIIKQYIWPSMFFKLYNLPSNTAVIKE